MAYLVQMHQTALEGHDDGLHAAMDTELRQDVLDVIAHGAARKAEALGDVVGAHAGGQKTENLDLAARKRLVDAPQRGLISVLAGRRLLEAARDLGCHTR